MKEGNYELKVLTELRDEIMKKPDEWFNRGITLCGDLARMVFDAIDKYIEMETKMEVEDDERGV